MIPPLPSDYNKSLSIFRNMMVLYYQEEVCKEVQKGDVAKMLRNHEIYQKEILTLHPYVCTVYNKIPVEFLPHPEYLIHSYPILTFYNHPSGKIYSYEEIRLTSGALPKREPLYKTNLNMDEMTKEQRKRAKIIWSRMVKTQYSEKPLNHMFQIHIPTTHLSKYFFENHKTNQNQKSKDLLLLFTKGLYLIATDYTFDKDGFELKAYESKTKPNEKYMNRSETIKILYNEVLYASLHRKMTYEALSRVFHISTIEKGAYLYHAVDKKYLSENPKCLLENPLGFFTLYPGHRIFDPFYLNPYRKFRTGLFLLKENLHVFNTTYTIFEKNIILGNLEDRENINYIDPTFQKRAKRELFTCSGMEFNKNNTKRIECGMDIYNQARTSGYSDRKRILFLMYKTLSYTDKTYWYDMYFRKYDIQGVYNNLAMYHDKTGYHSIATELHIFDKLQHSKEIEFIKMLN